MKINELDVPNKQCLLIFEQHSCYDRVVCVSIIAHFVSGLPSIKQWAAPVGVNPTSGGTKTVSPDETSCVFTHTFKD